MKSASNIPTTWAVIPVKPFALAKQRLASVLSLDERVRLARLMLEDVLAVLAGCRRLSGIMVVTHDSAVGELARGYGAVVLDDPAIELNAAVRVAVAHLAAYSDAGMIVVPADIPLLSIAVVESLIDRISGTRAVALVPATRDGGTNLLACRGADAVNPSFGPDSFRRHWQSACDGGLTPTVVASGDAGLDIDLPEDLAALCARPSKTRSYAFLATLDLERRLRINGGRHVRHPVEA